jgi:hypothetical protein
MAEVHVAADVGDLGLMRSVRVVAEEDMANTQDAWHVLCYSEH